MKTTKTAYVLLMGTLALMSQNAFGQSKNSLPEGRDVHGPLSRMPIQLEVRLALSALAPPLRDRAAVYVLDPARGYILARSGDNGQSCFVGRTEWKFADYRNDVYDPVCYDSEGAKNHMQVWFDVAKLRAQGVSPDAMKREIERRFSEGVYKAPSRPGLSYMIAPLMRSYMSLDPKDKNSVMTMSMPHLMYYAPNVTPGDVGAMPCPPCAPYPFVFEPGPHGYIIQRLGVAESAQVIEEQAGLLQELCSYDSLLCLASKKPTSAGSE